MFDEGRIRVLLVGDKQGDALLLGDMLRESPGLQVDLRHEFRLGDALSLLDVESFHVVMLDLTLPDSHGLEALEKAYPWAKHTPFVVLADETAGIEAVRVGAQDYLVKGRVDSNLLLRTIRYAIESKRAEKALNEALSRAQRERAKTEAILAAMGDGVSIQDREFRILYQNRAHKEMLGDHVGEHCYSAFAGRAEVCGECPVRDAFEDGKVHTYEKTIVSGPHMRRLEITASAFVDEDEGIAEGIKVVRDITGRKQDEEALLRVNRALRGLSECSKALVRETDEQSLLDRLCSIIVDVGGYSMAWVGYAEHDEAKSVSPMASAGHFAGYLDSIVVSWSEVETGMGPTGKAIRSGRPYIVRDIVDEPDFEPWREAAMKQGYASMIALPLVGGGRVFGALNIYAHEADAFDQEEVGLLVELADDLAYGVISLRTRAEHRQAEEALIYRFEIEKIVSGISTSFINIEPEYIDSEIERALREIGEFAGVDQSYVFLFDPGGTKVDITHVWFGEGAEKKPVLLKGLSIEMFRYISVRLKRLEIIHIPGVEYLPPEAEAERALMRSQGVKSIIIVPLVHSGRLTGCIGFASTKDEKTWFREDAALLKMVGSVFISAFERKKASKKVRSRLERLKALRTVDMAISGSLDLRVILNVFMDQLIGRLRVDAAALLLMAPGADSLKYAAAKGLCTDAALRTEVRLGEGCAGRVALERTPVAVPDMSRAPEGSAPSGIFSDEGFMAYFAMPLMSKGHVKGVLEVFHRTPLKPDEEWLDFLEALANQVAIAIDNANLFDDLQHSRDQLFMAYDTTIEGWSRALDYRDKETEGHSQRVTEMTVRIARDLGMGKEEVVHIRRGALLHDIGKLGVPDHILFKPGSLTEEEWEKMKRHPEIAYELLSPIEFLKPALDIPYCHHEKWDGTGYPRGLKGEEIPLAARIFALVDVWDALCLDRPYRPAWPRDKVREYVIEMSGRHFDPKVVETFLKMERE
jgi:response regulator RpfG family c-di-GMP phosphodiesterase